MSINIKFFGGPKHGEVRAIELPLPIILTFLVPPDINMSFDSCINGPVGELNILTVRYELKELYRAGVFLRYEYHFVK